MKGIFIYGFTKTESGKNLDLKGVGNPTGKVQILNYQDLGVIVSESTFKTYQALPKEETIKDLVIYQKILETLMKDFPLVPVKFGAMVKNKKEALTLLDKGYFRLKNEFRKIEDKIELDVVVTWELAKIIKDIYQKSKAVQRQQEKVERSNKIEAKLALGKLVDKLLKARKIKYQKAILKALKKVSVDFCPHHLFDETVIFNGAFLLGEAKENHAPEQSSVHGHELNSAHEPEQSSVQGNPEVNFVLLQGVLVHGFEEALKKLDEDFLGLLDFRCVGPLPPYSFSTAEVLKMEPKEVEKAKKIFGLDGEVTRERLKRAYRKLALLHHPDKNEGMKQKAFAVINSAYGLLKEYSRNGYLNVEIKRLENL